MRWISLITVFLLPACNAITGVDDLNFDGTTDSDADTDSDTDTDTDSDSDTDTDTDTDTDCVPESYQQCGADGDVHWFDSCDVEGAVADDCHDDNAECVDLTTTTAQCQCLGNWAGDDCTECASNWDVSFDCNQCLYGWFGSDCDECRIYVDIDSIASVPDGLSWTTAMDSIQDGIDAANTAYTSASVPSVCEVWVAEGKYYIYKSDDSDTVQLHPFVHVYGGFDGAEATLDERDWLANNTAIDGSESSSSASRVSHVVTGADNSVLDGFMVTGGMADGPTSDDEDGGGMYNYNVSPTVRNCIFYNNYALNFGGGIYNFDNNGVVENCIFQTNVSANRGGGMFTNDSDLTITNCDFVNNTANIATSLNGGGLYDYEYSHVVVTNAIFWNNHPDQIYSNSMSYPVIVSNCLVQGGYSGGTDIVDAGPLFVDEALGDFRLTDTSPCIDAADGTAATATDIAGSARVDVPWVADTGSGPPWADIGTFEYIGEEPIWVTMIAGSSFDMGSSTGDADEIPVHTVNMTGFDITVFEVTVSQYAACIDAGGCSDPDVGGSCNWEIAGMELHPINCVSWQQAVDFCTWVDAGGRLPTEAEWEYAARGMGGSITYPWGEDTPVPDYHAAMSGSSCGTCPVCNTPDGNTTQGLCDMAGNVWEWVEDWYHSSYTSAPTDGSAWVTPPGTHRVMRGGSYGNTATALRTTNRAYYDPVGYAYLGFRCAR